MTRKHMKSRDQSPASVSRRYKGQKRSLTWLWIGLVVLLLAVAGIWALSSLAGFSATKRAAVVDISAAEAYAKVQQGVFILDVRTREEWDDFHIKGSTLIPLSELSDRLAELPRDKDIVVVCRSGNRSLTAANILLQAGFTRLSSLSGGLQAWMDAGYPLEE
jgi:rhodanese-related sulfurtransferase